MRTHAADLTWSELNMVLMGQVMALRCCDSQLLRSSVHRRAPKKQEKSTTQFQHLGHCICKTQCCQSVGFCSNTTDSKASNY